MVTVIAPGHHHRPTIKTSHKPFKSKHATKSALKTKAKGKLEDFEKGRRKTPHQTVMSKIERKNKARQKQLLRHQEVVRINKIFDGRKGAPRIIAIVPLTDDVSCPEAVDAINGSLDISVDVPVSGLLTVGVERFKQKLQYIIPANRDFRALSDACKVADFVVFVISAVTEVDAHGEFLIRAIEGQGISNTAVAIQHLNQVQPPKRQLETKKSLLSFMQHFFPTEERLYSLDSPQELSNLIRSLSTQHPKGINWRDARSYMLAEEVSWDDVNGLVVSGTVRGKGMKADRLVHIPGHGDFQIEKICAYPEEPTERKGGDEMAVDGAESELKVLDAPTQDQDSLEELAPEELVMDDVDTRPMEPRKGVLLDDHHYFDEPEKEAYTAPKKLPKGTSSYQAAWLLDGEDYSDVESEDEDDEMNDGRSVRPEDGEEGMDIDGKSMREPTEFGDAQSEMFLDPSPDQEMAQIEEFRNRRKEMEEDLEFPDEIELHPNVLARERLSRYRGLKSLRTSVWETSEDKPFEPPEWNRLARIENYKGLKNKTIDEALVGGVPAGTKVRMFIRGGSAEIAKSFTAERPFAVFSLLRHEHKKAVVNITLMPNSDYEEPVRSKDELIVQCGPRMLQIKPLFSQGGVTPNKVHKFEKFLQPGRSVIASFIGPMAFGSIPALFYKKQEDGSLALIGSGSFLSADHSRIIAKRIVLTGHPYKIHKKVVTVRYMFFNAEDVQWFKALQLFTKRGRTGYIKESLGTHGYFKATFDGKINPQDAVAISLYKRVFPRMAEEVKF